MDPIAIMRPTDINIIELVKIHPHITTAIFMLIFFFELSFKDIKGKPNSCSIRLSFCSTYQHTFL